MVRETRLLLWESDCPAMKSEHDNPISGLTVLNWFWRV